MSFCADTLSGRIHRFAGEDADATYAYATAAADILIDDWFKYSGLWNQMGGVFVMYRNNAETLAIVHALMAGHVHSTAVAKHEAHR